MKYCTHCGAEPEDGAAVCPRCGAACREISGVPPMLEDRSEAGLNVLSFLAPLVGLILYLIYRGSMPCRARGIKKVGLLGLGLSVLLVACIGVFAGGEIARQNEIREAQEAAEQARQRADDLHRQSQEIQEALENARRALESYYGS